MSWINTLRTSAEDCGTLAKNNSSTFFEEVEHSRGAVQRNLQFPSGRHVVENESHSEGDFKIRQPESPPVCFHEFCG